MKKIILIGLILILGLCLMTVPASAKIYGPWGFGSILVDPIGPTPDCPSDFQVSATTECIPGSDYPALHLTWPAYSWTKPTDEFTAWLKMQPLGPKPSWT